MWEEDEEPGFKTWWADNVRIIISILVVVAIALAIYSYSKRTIIEEPKSKNNSAFEDKSSSLEGSSSNSSEVELDEVRKILCK